MPEASKSVISEPPAATGRFPALRLALLLSLVLAGPDAAAQMATSETVRARQGGPEFAPIGMELDQVMSTAGLMDKQSVRDKSSAASSFIVFPKLEMKTSYETNVFRDDSRKHDKIVEISPSLSLKSDWSRHSASLALSSDIGRYAANTDEDYEDVRATAAGTAEVTDRVDLTGQVQLARLHQQRGELLDPGAAGGVTVYVQSGVVLGANYKGDAFQGLAQLAVTSATYESNAAVDNSALDRVVTAFKVRGSYEYQPGTALFVEPSLNNREYDTKTTSSGRLQGSNGWQILTGVAWDVSGVTFAEFGVGYLQQDFDEPSFRTISGPSFSAKLIWNATDLVTIEGNAGRSINETQDPDASGALVTSVGLRADYALRDNLMLSLGGRYSFEEVEGTDEENDRYAFDLEARYLVNEYFYLRMVGGYDRTISSEAGSSFSNLRASVSIGAQI